MSVPQRIHILGASGSGTSTLAAGIAQRWGHRHLDTDRYFWLPSDPPFQSPRPVNERLLMLRQSMSEAQSWVLSGSLCGWGDVLIPQFSLVVFLYLPQLARIERLKARETSRYGSAAVSAGGVMYKTHLEFIDWAARYDSGGPEMRSLAAHETWLLSLPCPVIRIEGELSRDETLGRVADWVQAHPL